MLALLGMLSMAAILILLNLLLVLLYQGNMAGVVGVGAFLIFLISPVLCIVLLLVGAVMGVVIGREDISWILCGMPGPPARAVRSAGNGGHSDADASVGGLMW